MILCLGEALVDLIDERPAGAAGGPEHGPRPHFGGALANVAVAAARAGAPAGLAGAAGEDEWGRWLRERLQREGVDLRFFELLPGRPTPVAVVTVDAAGEPSFEIHGAAVEAAVASVAPRLEPAIDAAGALVFGSTTLATPAEREVTVRARELALQRGVPVCLDPNIRPNRWGGDFGRAAAAARELVPGSLLVRANREEAAAIAGVADPVAAAERIVAGGASLAVVTLGADGALVRGACAGHLPAPEVDVVTTLGAGDALMGTLVGELALRGWDPGRALEALGPALDAAAAACGRWSALD